MGIEGFSITFPGLLQAGAVGVLLMIVLMIMRGVLVPKDALTRERENTQLWKDACEKKDVQLQEQLEALVKAVDGLQTVEHLIRAVRGYPEEEKPNVALEAQRTRKGRETT